MDIIIITILAITLFIKDIHITCLNKTIKRLSNQLHLSIKENKKLYEQSLKNNQ